MLDFKSFAGRGSLTEEVEDDDDALRDDDPCGLNNMDPGIYIYICESGIGLL